MDNDTLLLLQATPRKWLEDGKTIEVRSAPTYYGPLSMKVESRAGSGAILAEIDMSERRQPGTLLVRLRHPQCTAIRSVTVNGNAWDDFDVRREWMRIEHPQDRRYSIVVSYR
jgi:hypothetical protein